MNIIFICSEENVYKLCQDVSTKHQSEIEKCHVVFISNPTRTVPLWRQRAGKDEDRLVIWVRFLQYSTIFFLLILFALKADQAESYKL